MIGVYLWLLINLVPIAIASVAPPYDGKTKAPAYPIGKVKRAFAKTNGRLFSLNGKTQYFAGTNAWWLGRLRNNSDIDLVMNQISGSGLKVLRVWGFSAVNNVPSDSGHDYDVWFQLINSTGTYVNYGSNGLDRLDYVVSAAERHNLYLVLPFNNNWDDLGGVNIYSNAFGTGRSDWYTDSRCQSAYRSYVETLVRRYKSSPAIFSWELANEPRCTQCGDTTRITNWAAGVSQFIKSIDPNHMVALGDEGWFAPGDGVGDGSYAYSGYESVDFVKNLQIASIDYGTFHLYPNGWGYDYSWGSSWIQQHDTVGKQLGKPVVLEEYGTPFPHNHAATEGPWQDTIVKNTSVAIDQFWQFGTQISTGSTYSDDNTLWFNDAEYTTLVRQHAAAMAKKKV